MGSSTSQPLLPEPKHYSLLDYGYCKVWKRNDTNRQTMEQYHINIDSQDELARYRNMWEFRMKDDHVVSVYYFTHQKPEEMCGVYQKCTILIERIPYRLSQFCNIPYEESLAMIKMALSSYRQLHIQYGLFFVRSTMLAINSQNQLKVWHHTDLSQPLPQNSNCSSVFDMINSIISSIQVNADMPSQYVRFSQFVKVNRNKINPGFDQMLEVLETYKEMNRIPDYDRLPKLDYYLRRAEGWQQATFNSKFLSNMAQYDPQSIDFPREVSSKRSSIHSSKTMKNTKSPSRMNIYTHKEVNQVMERQNYLKRNLFQVDQQELSQSQLSNRLLISSSGQGRRNQRISHGINHQQQQQPQYQQRSSYGNSPVVREESPCIKIVTKTPSQHTKIQFKIIPTIKNNCQHPSHTNNQRNPSIYQHNAPHGHSLSQNRPHPLNSSIQKRIQLQPEHQKVPSVQVIPPPPATTFSRRNRVHFNPNGHTNTLQRSSSLNLMDSMRAQI